MYMYMASICSIMVCSIATELLEKGWDTDSDSIVDSNEDAETTKYSQYMYTV